MEQRFRRENVLGKTPQSVDDLLLLIFLFRVTKADGRNGT